MLNKKPDRSENRLQPAFATLWLVGSIIIAVLLVRLGFAESNGAQTLAPRTKAIEELRVGDWVVANDPGDGGEPSPHRITGVHRNYTLHVVHVRVRTRDGVSGEVLATREHPFFTRNRGWIHAKDLAAGDQLQNPTGSAVPVEAVTIEDREADTFNLTVDGVHTFYVSAGKEPVLVHNSDSSDAPLQGSGGDHSVYRIPGEQLTTGKDYIGKTGRPVPSRMSDPDHVAKTVSGEAPTGETMATNLTADEASGVEAITIKEEGLDNLTNKINGRNLALPKNQQIKAAGEHVLGRPCP